MNVEEAKGKSGFIHFLFQFLCSFLNTFRVCYFVNKLAKTATPQIIINTPSGKVIRLPITGNFSIAITAALSTMNQMFVRPPTNASSINAQQQPTQVTP